MLHIYRKKRNSKGQLTSEGELEGATCEGLLRSLLFADFFDWNKFSQGRNPLTKANANA
ncbi:hypothetical protein J41TS4_43930 [Paenibacillus apis]|uniref:Uncharacterized protein n=1 Tax=Paenibacillus apis TaxID=1792174 RepID=A0A920CMP5_9BACL|nr:hypothetical protein J41TS4_43930 [Paenibacillus apis]